MFKLQFQSYYKASDVVLMVNLMNWSLWKDYKLRYFN